MTGRLTSGSEGSTVPSVGRRSESYDYLEKKLNSAIARAGGKKWQKLTHSTLDNFLQMELTGLSIPEKQWMRKTFCERIGIALPAESTEKVTNLGRGALSGRDAAAIEVSNEIRQAEVEQSKISDERQSYKEDAAKIFKDNKYLNIGNIDSKEAKNMIKQMAEDISAHAKVYVAGSKHGNPYDTEQIAKECLELLAKNLGMDSGDKFHKVKDKLYEKLGLIPDEKNNNSKAGSGGIMGLTVLEKQCARANINQWKKEGVHLFTKQMDEVLDQLGSPDSGVDWNLLERWKLGYDIPNSDDIEGARNILVNLQKSLAHLNMASYVMRKIEGKTGQELNLYKSLEEFRQALRSVVEQCKHISASGSGALSQKIALDLVGRAREVQQRAGSWKKS